MAIYCQHYEINCLACTDQLRESRGCVKNIEGSIAGIEVVRCPRKYVGMPEITRMQAYTMYKKGFLPNSGTWMDQPQKFFDAMDVIEKVVTEIQEAESKRKK